MNAHTLPQPKVEANVFQQWFDAGYHDLLPVVPPNAKCKPTSHVAAGRGKSPGIRDRSSGLWTGLMGWNKIQATLADLDEWHAMGASTGLRLGKAWMLDLDIYDADTAAAVEAKAIEMLGPAPMRVGQWPKRSLLYACSGDIKAQKMHFAGKQGEVNNIEIPPQSVIAGIHAKTGKPYEWRRKLVKIDQLTVVTPDALASFLKAMRAMLPAATAVSGASDATVNQRTLAGNPDVIAEIMSRIPNPASMRWDDMIKMGYAVKASLPDAPELAFDLWDEWCSRWEEDGYNQEVARARWDSLKGPYRIGAEWLYNLGDALLGSENHFYAKAFITEIDDTVAEPEPALALTPTIFRLRPLAEIPKRQWIYDQHLIRGFVSTTVAPGGLGKSSLIIVEALAMASGKPLLGVEPRGQFRVWLWNGEDPADELERRVAAAMQHYGLSQTDIGDRLLVDSGRSMEIVLARQVRGGAAIQQPVANALEDALRRRQIDVMQIDPFISSHRVRESDNDDIDLVVKQWGRIAGRCGVAIELVHHVRKTGGQETTVEDARGAGALINAARSARVLTRMTPQEAKGMGVEDSHRRFFRFGADAKNNLAPLSSSSSTKWFELQSVDLANGQGDALDAIMTGDSVGVVSLWAGATPALAVAADASAKAFEMIDAGEYRMDVRSGGDWAGHAVAAAFGLVVDEPEDKAQIKAWIAEMIRAKRLEQVMKLDKQRKRRAFVRVVRQSVIQDIFH